MSYSILFHTLDNDMARKLYDEMKAEGHRCYPAAPNNPEGGVSEALQNNDAMDVLVLSIPTCALKDKRVHSQTIRDELDTEALLDELSCNVNGILQTTFKAIPLLQKGKLKRIVMLTDPASSIRETREEKDYAYHMSQAAANMILKILFNTYRPEGFTFRCFAQSVDGIGIGAMEYIFTDQSFIETDDPIHSDENRLVMRDGMLRELSW
ncbi:MAG: hypothetical protein J6P60_00300 [Lachnospiraceae bacterium]|nr:hypothetical protein [Lachnospiraceae bacterium]